MKKQGKSPYLWISQSDILSNAGRSDSKLDFVNVKRSSVPMTRQSTYLDKDQEIRRAIVLRDYHDQPFLDRNYGQIRGLFESPMRKIIRHEGIAFMGEFLGTFSFLYMAFMIGQAISATRLEGDPPHAVSDEAGYLVIAFGFGMALMVNVAVWFRVSGGQFNPAVSLGLLIMGAIKPARFVVVVIAQILGAILASAVVNALTAGKLGVVTALSTSGNVSDVQGFFIEMLGTAQLMLVIFFVAVEKHRATPMAPLFIGLTLFLIVLLGARYTGASVNPARSLGPAIVAGSYDDIWIYLVAPFTGSLLATAIYAFIKWTGYQDVNASQDAISVAEAEYVLPDKGREFGGR